MKHLLFLLMVAFAGTSQMLAQTTHAHAASQQWKGVNMEDHITNFPIFDESSETSTQKKVFLYNVGTGRFVSEGGDWGVEGRLMHEDFGRRMSLRLDNSRNLRIHPDIVENTNANLRVFICNIPNVTKGSNWNDCDKYAYTTVMDGATENGKWKFERVEGETGDTYTYYMYTQPSKGGSTKTKFYLGAAYGEWFTQDSQTNNTKIDANGDYIKGYYAHVDDDRTTWTRAGQEGNDETLPTVNETLVEVNGEMVPIKELYQWRLVTEEEFYDTFNRHGNGLYSSVSPLIPDRDFSRNATDFYDENNGWQKDRNFIPIEVNDYRYGYAWGNYKLVNGSPVNQKGEYFDKDYDSNERWCSAVVLKKQFDKIKDAKYGYLSFEGAGITFVNLELPKVGWYVVDVAGINFSTNHDAYLIAFTGTGALYMFENEIDFYDPLPTTANVAKEGFMKMKFPRYNTPYALPTYEDITLPANKDKNDEGLSLSVGKILLKHRDDYRRKIAVYVDYALDDAGEKTSRIDVLSLGIVKPDATKSTKSWSKTVTETYNEWNEESQAYEQKEREVERKYYYDTDWVVMDDIRMSYLGDTPCFLFEEEETLDYLVYDEEKTNERPMARSTNRYDGSVMLKRTMQKDKWNTFSLPIPLTGEQVRYAFGEDATLLELNSIGGLSQNANVIDFKTVELKPNDPMTHVVEPGKLYLLKPTVNPADGVDPNGNPIQYYRLGCNTFSVEPTQPDVNEFEYFWLDTSKLNESTAVNSWNGSESVSGGNNDGMGHVCYTKTPGYSTFHVTNGIYDGAVAPAGSYAPKGSYVMSNNKMYELNKDTRIKGFRGWITTAHSILNNQQAQAAMSINGIIDGDVVPTDIVGFTTDTLPISEDDTIYTLDGRKVATRQLVNSSTCQLPKGIYIVGGRKMLIK